MPEPVAEGSGGAAEAQGRREEERDLGDYGYHEPDDAYKDQKDRGDYPDDLAENGLGCLLVRAAVLIVPLHDHTSYPASAISEAEG